MSNTPHYSFLCHSYTLLQLLIQGGNIEKKMGASVFHETNTDISKDVNLTWWPGRMTLCERS